MNGQFEIIFQHQFMKLELLLTLQRACINMRVYLIFIMASTCLLGCSPSEQELEAKLKQSDFHLAIPRKDTTIPDTFYLGKGEDIVRKIFLTNSTILELAKKRNIDNHLNYKLLFAKSNNRLLYRDKINNDTVYVLFRAKETNSRPFKLDSLIWGCSFMINYKTNNKKVDTIFTIMDKVYIKE